MKYDFGGYATRINLKCSDGRVIRRDAFKDDDGQTVPLVWQHMRNEPSNVLGHALLEHRKDGVYCYCKFNNSPTGKNAKLLVQHGDMKALSIYANHLQQNGNDVVHGTIREVSLVMAGANPGAYIDNVYLSHADGSSDLLDDEAIIQYVGPAFKMGVEHADTDEDDEDYDHEDETDNEDEEDDTDEDETEDETDNEDEDEDDEDEDDMEHAEGRTIKEVFEEFTTEQKNVVYAMVAYALGESDSNAEHSDEGGSNMPRNRNIFENENDTPENVLSHEEMMEIFDDGPRYGSLKKSALEHGITDIDMLFPEAKATNPVPELITRQMEWVSKVWNATRKSPFSRIKSIAANLTEDEARAKGYIKGKKKLEEQFGLLKRATTPQTVYKKQSLDRDDIIDITDFDVVAWLKAEMRMMLNEELARAILVGDGRNASAEDKINPINIRPIWTDDDMYTIKYEVEMPTTGDRTDETNAIIDAANMARIDYKGSGTPTFYTSSKTLTTMLLAKDKIGHRLYANVGELASALRVKEIVEVAVMDNLTREGDNGSMELIGLIVNLSDYTVGADKGGAVSMFDDFDIDYNKEKYLIETRCSGALTHPYSAIALEMKSSGGAAG